MHSATTLRGSRVRPSDRCGVKAGKRPPQRGNGSIRALRSAVQGARPAAAGSIHTVADTRCRKTRTPLRRASNGSRSAARAASSGAAAGKSASGTKPKTRFTWGGQRRIWGSYTARMSWMAGQSPAGGSHATAVRGVGATAMDPVGAPGPSGVGGGSFTRP